MEALEGVAEKTKKVSDYREKLLESIVEYDEVKFKKVSEKSKMDILTSIEKDVKKYETKA